MPTNQILKNMGRAGDSFNDVISHLVKKAGNSDERLLQSDRRPGNHNQTVVYPKRPNFSGGMFDE